MSIPDAHGLVREWLREQTEIVAITDMRQFFKMPEKPKPTLPCIVLIRVGGEISDEIDYPRMSFSCWGENKHEASTVGYRLADVLDRASRRSSMRLDSGLIKSVYDVVAPIDIQGVDWAKAVRVQASFMTSA